MSSKLAELARRKCAATSIDESLWQGALESAEATLIGLKLKESVADELFQSSSTPSQLTQITRLIYQNARSHLHGEKIAEHLLEAANESRFSLSDWLDGLDYFYEWLSSRQRKIDFQPMLEYLQCCAVSPDAQEGGQTMLSLVQDMLETFGYDAG